MAEERVAPFLMKTLKKVKGVTDIKLARRKKHPILHWEYKGQSMKYICPFSASDRRTRKNCLAEIRRMLCGQERRI
jgi:hypothetical protein